MSTKPEPIDVPQRNTAGMTAQVHIRLITPAATLPLRCEVLRPGCAIGEAVFEGDDDVHTQHWGVFVDDTLVAVASLYQEPMPESTDPHAWRLRGMAVSPASQGQGYGRQLLERSLQSVADQSGTLLWCNARSAAVSFYKKVGFEVVGAEFVIPGIGAHYVMQVSMRGRRCNHR